MHRKLDVWQKIFWKQNELRWGDMVAGNSLAASLYWKDMVSRMALATALKSIGRAISLKSCQENCNRSIISGWHVKVVIPFLIYVALRQLGSMTPIVSWHITVLEMAASTLFFFWPRHFIYLLFSNGILVNESACITVYYIMFWWLKACAFDIMCISCAYHVTFEHFY